MIKGEMNIIENKANSEDMGLVLRFAEVLWLVMVGFMLAGAATLYAKVSGTSGLEKYATIEAYSDDVPVYAFGFTYVYGVSPDFLPGTVLQTGNTNPKNKIQPKKSWEIKENKMGINPTSVPRTGVNDNQPFRSVHLIDGDVNTCWCSRPQIQPDVEDVWIRIDLPREEQIKSVILVPHPKGQSDQDEEENTLLGQAFPRHLTIKTSHDAWHWETVYENRNFGQLKKMVSQELTFAPRRAKQIWIIGRSCPQILSLGCGFSIAEVKINNINGNNRALLSQGAAVTVSSTYFGDYSSDRFMHDMLWPTLYDIGCKWLRVGHGKDMFTWSYVERVKGVFDLDPRADEVITEAVQNGINVIMILNKGRKWLFVKEPKVFDKTRNEWVFPEFWTPQNPNKNKESMQGYLKYVRFMVHRFKNRVKYFEIWNEWDEGADEYCKFFEPAVKVIREEYPEAKIVIGSPTPEETPSFIYGVLGRSGPIFDVVGWHPWYNPDPTQKKFLEYSEFLKNFKKECKARGFKGEYMATEWTWCAPYPPVVPTGVGDSAFSNVKVTEMQKAKYAARLTMTHLAADVYSFWCELFRQQSPQLSIGLFRNTFSASPLSPTQPEPVYYIMRTLSTVMDETTPEKVKVEFNPCDKRLESYTFRKPDGELMLVVWLNGYAKDDDSQEIITDITFPGRKLNKASAIDVLNGDSQALNVLYDKKNTVINRIHVKDWPIIISGFES
jgi:hypothetical protein